MFMVPTHFHAIFRIEEAALRRYDTRSLKVIGDLGRQDEEGYLYLVDRKNNIINSGGYNIFPREIEEVLHHHPAVAEAAVVGKKDDYWGEAVRSEERRGGEEGRSRWTPDQYKKT